MFDFYPIISKGSTFLELFKEAFMWSFLTITICWILVGVLLVFSKSIAVIFHRRVIAYSLLITIPILTVLLSLQAIYEGKRISNTLFLATMYGIILFLFSIVLYVQSTRMLLQQNETKGKFANKMQQFGAKFQSQKQIVQIAFLVSVFMSIVSFGNLQTIMKNKYLYFFMFVFVTSLFGYLLSKKEEDTEKKLTYRRTDILPFLIIGIIAILLSFQTIGSVVCAIPKLNCYFSCGVCD